MQGYLLRVLQENVVRPVGSDRELPVDVRIIAATHVDLQEGVRTGRFRADLFARLAQLVLTVPPLRARRTEILRLAHEFAPDLSWAPGAAEALLLWDWPANVRELRAVVAATSTLGAGVERVRARDLAERVPSAARVLEREPAPEHRTGDDDTAQERRRRLELLLKAHDGNIARVARELGKPRAQIYRWMRAFGLASGKR